MKNFLSGILAVLMMAAFVGLLVVGILAHTGNVDPHRMANAITGKLNYPDNLFGGGK